MNPQNSKDFVRKLYNMLEESAYEEIVRWSVDGESFVVLDPSEFTKRILPRHFKHSNFASFVRQLNKYDFHKVRTTPQEQRMYGANSWKFNHPEFQHDKKELLDNIKRKAPVRKATNPVGTGAGSVPGQDQGDNVAAAAAAVAGSVNASGYGGGNVQGQSTGSAASGSLPNEAKELIDNLQKEVIRLQDSQNVLINRINILQQSYDMNLRSVQQMRDHAFITEGCFREMLNLLILSNVGGQPQQFQNLLDTLNNYGQMQMAMPGHSVMGGNGGPGGGGPAGSVDLNNSAYSEIHDMQFDQASVSSGHHNHHHQQQQQHSGQLPVGGPIRGPLRRPLGPPYRILLGEEDSLVSRLCGNFINQYGSCTLDVVSDGLELVQYAQVHDSYDLIILDAILPSLDGVSAAELIRRSQPAVPILLMTSKADSDAHSSYLRRGVSEILVKPFSKGLLNQKLDYYLKGE